MRSFTFRAGDKTLDLGERTALMGVVNVTPDSFYPESRHPKQAEAVTVALELLEAGADVIDVGGESARPGARPISEREELRRVLPVIEALRPRTDTLISVDTQKASVAEAALSAGADLVNDVSGLRADRRMAGVVAAGRSGLVLMHMKGTPATMQQKPTYRDVVREVRDYLAEAISVAEAAGVAADGILVDPGIGFGKTVEHNLTLLNELPALAELGKPILVGTSRKGFIGHLLSEPPEHRLLGTAASVACAILRGAHVVRVHDVREMRQVATVADAIRNEKPSALSPREKAHSEMASR